MSDWYYYERKPLKKPKAGIKSQSKRGNFAESWWAKRWIAVLERFNIGARLSRGKSYARGGQVVSIDISKGQVKAKVQGTSSKPYAITIKLTPLNDNDWKAIIDSISTQVIYAAKLLAGEMPTDIEELFSKAGLSLFPKNHNDLDTDCSCPDWSNPCKHIAAVYYLLGEEFDRDPFLIFKLRGNTREEFLALLGNAGISAEQDVQDVQIEPLPVEPLSEDFTKFWHGDVKLSDNFLGEIDLPVVNAALPKRLGNISFWKSDIPFIEALEPFYAAASKRGLGIVAGDPDYKNGRD